MMCVIGGTATFIQVIRILLLDDLFAKGIYDLLARETGSYEQVVVAGQREQLVAIQQLP